MRYDHFTVKGEDGTDSTLKLHRLKAGLNFRANPTSRLSLFGRLTTSKIVNNGGDIASSSQNTENTGTQGRGYHTAQVFLERAFINYMILDKLVLTFGRLPTVDGPPKHVYSAQPRQGTYLALGYSTILDGYALTYNLDISASQSVSFRYIYTPMQTVKSTIQDMLQSS